MRARCRAIVDGVIDQGGSHVSVPDGRGRRSSLARAAVLLCAACAAALAAFGLAVRSAHAGPAELFFSEYVEGSSSNKALEIFNGTGAPVTLTGAYDIQIFANGSPTATAAIPLTGTVADGDVFVLARSAAVQAILAQADQTTTNFLFNGNDAIALRHHGTVVDVIGQVGVDPGVAWGTGDVTTTDHTLRRKPSILAGDGNGADVFDPAIEWNGFPIDSFDGLGSHAVSLGGGGSSTARGAEAPTPADDSASTDEDEPLSIDVLANDTDPDGDALTVTSASDPEHGQATVEADGSVTYAPEPDYAGGDSFAYTVADSQGNTASATVTIVVNPVEDDPDLEDDAAATQEDVPVVIDVLANDEDVDGDTLVVTAVGQPDHGIASLSGNGTAVLYSPAPDTNGTDTFEVTVSDGQGGSDTSLVTITIASVNDPPHAVLDAVNAVQGVTLLVDVLANDAPGPADEAGQPLALVSVGQPAHGQAAVVPSGPDEGKVSYTPAPGYLGPDSFTYVVSDGELEATGTVSVGVKAQVISTLCGRLATIVGTRGDDTLVGTPGDDVIRAGRGNDTIDGGGGNDVICAGPGADRITTGDGDDRISAGTGADIVEAGGGNNRVRGGFGADELTAGRGNDVVVAGPGPDTVDAGDGRNRVAGGLGDDTLTAGRGDDWLDGGAGTDACDPGGGHNTVRRCE
jgi:Ca2+-binding RTX toxin-like protein